MSTPLLPPADGAEPPTHLTAPDTAPSMLMVVAYPAAAAVVMMVTEDVSPTAIAVLRPTELLIFGVEVVLSAVVK